MGEDHSPLLFLSQKVFYTITRELTTTETQPSHLNPTDNFRVRLLSYLHSRHLQPWRVYTGIWWLMIMLPRILNLSVQVDHWAALPAPPSIILSYNQTWRPHYVTSLRIYSLYLSPFFNLSIIKSLRYHSNLFIKASCQSTNKSCDCGRSVWRFRW